MAEKESVSSQQRIFFDEVYDTNITITPLEKKIVDAEVFKRLKKISQLGLAYLIYPDAKHSRFEHCLGTMYLAGKVAKTLGLSKDDVQYFRLAALLHDVGHGPFSHAFEEYLKERKKIRGHEDLTKWVILNSEIEHIIGDSGFDLKKIAELSVGKIRDKKLSFLNSLILGVIDVDKMDFLVRDAYFTKSRCGEIDVNELASSVKKVNEGKVAWGYQCFSSLETFFQCKKDMYMSVYYSKKVRAVDIMIKAMIKFSEEQFDWCGFKEIEDFELLTDSYVLGKIQAMSHSRSVSTEMAFAVRLYKDLLKKNLLRNVFEKTYFTYNSSFEDFVANAEEEILSGLENSLNLDRRLTFVDVQYLSSGSVMSFTKTGQVKVYVLRGEDVFDIMDMGDSLRRLLSTCYRIIRVYTVSKYAKKLRKMKDIIQKTVEDLFVGT